MTLTTVPAISTGDVWTAPNADNYLTDNLNSHKAYAEGTAPFPGTSQAFANDSALQLRMVGGNPELGFDSNDLLAFIRASNRLGYYVGNVEKFAIDANGLIQAAAFHSTEQTITAGSTATIAHGLGVRPSWWGGVYGTTTGTANATRLVIPSFNSLGSFVRISEVDATNITVINGTAVTVFVYVNAQK